MAELIVVVIMVKNEQDNIVQTLEPLLNAGIKSFLVYDTGSTDNTISTIKQFLEVKETTHEIIVDPFVDFSTSRNKALDYGDNKFKDKKFMFMIDAEWYIVNPEGLFDFCNKFEDDKDDVYHITVKSYSGKSYRHSRLIRINGNAYFTGTVHEGIDNVSIKYISSTTYLAYKPKVDNVGRWKRDIGYLLTEYFMTKDKVDDPNKLPYVYDPTKGRRHNLQLKYIHEKPAGLDPRTVFYLAQTYDCLDEVEQAVKYYIERSKMGGYLQETFMALYRVGLLLEKTDWPRAASYYLTAYEKCSSRIEPLVKLAQHHNDNGENNNAQKIKYMYAKQACLTPKPEYGLFLENEIYDYHRWDQLGIAAWYMGFYEEGYEAVKKALLIHPEKIHLQESKELYEKKLDIVDIEKIRIYENNDIKILINNVNYHNNVKILNLILYNTDSKYDQMKSILEEYNKKCNIKSYFYCYDPNLDEDHKIIDNILYIKGVESYLPGILSKTLDAFDIFKDYDYDYIVRTNISTIIDYKELDKYLKETSFDYGGPLYYVGNYVDLQAGMTKEKNAKYRNHHFVSGCCIVLNKKTVKLLAANKNDVLSYGLIDDVGIGVYLHDKGLIRRRFGNNDSYLFNSKSIQSGITMYRNKHDDRDIDIINMRHITSNLI